MNFWGVLNYYKIVGVIVFILGNVGYEIDGRFVGIIYVVWFNNGNSYEIIYI